MSNETEREAFEAWAIGPEGPAISVERWSETGGYKDEGLNYAYDAWQAALLRAQQPGQWLPIESAPIGDYWFALDCGHVVMGFKAGDGLVDWESAIDHDCCADAAATCCMPVIPPTPPQGASNASES
jgi:hypothetical protein